jgi:hypothetical protein
MAKDFLKELTRHQVGRLRVQGMPLPIYAYLNAYMLIIVTNLACLVPNLVSKTLYSADLLIAPSVNPYLSSDEYYLLYELLVEIQAR